MNEANQDWRWLPQWAPTFAVLVALLAAVVPASFHLGGQLARLDQGQSELKAGLVRLETRLEARVETLFGQLRDEIRANRTEISRVQESVADVRERVSALEARED